MTRRPAILAASLAALAFAVYAACNPEVKPTECTAHVEESCGGEVSPPSASGVKAEADCCSVTFTLDDVKDGLETIERWRRWTGPGDCPPDERLPDVSNPLSPDVRWEAVIGDVTTNGIGTAVTLARPPGAKDATCTFYLRVTSKVCPPPGEVSYSASTNFPSVWLNLPEIVGVNDFFRPADDSIAPVETAADLQTDADDLKSVSWGADPDPDTLEISSQTSMLRVLSNPGGVLREGFSIPGGGNAYLEGRERSARIGDAVVRLQCSAGGVSCTETATTTVVSVSIDRIQAVPVDPFPQVEIRSVDNLVPGQIATVRYEVLPDIANPSGQSFEDEFEVSDSPGTHEYKTPAYWNRFGNAGQDAFRYTLRHSTSGAEIVEVGHALSDHLAMTRGLDGSLLQMGIGDAFASTPEEALGHLAGSPTFGGPVRIVGTTPDFSIPDVLLLAKTPFSYLTNEMVVATGEDAVSRTLHGVTSDSCTVLSLTAPRRIPVHSERFPSMSEISVSGAPDSIKSAEVKWEVLGGHAALVASDDSRTGSVITCDYPSGIAAPPGIRGLEESQEMEDVTVKLTVSVDDSAQNPKFYRGGVLEAKARLTVVGAEWRKWPNAATRTDVVCCDLDLRPSVEMLRLSPTNGNGCAVGGRVRSYCDVVRDILVNGMLVPVSQLRFCGRSLSDLDRQDVEDMTWGMPPPYDVEFDCVLDGYSGSNVVVEAYGTRTRYPGRAERPVAFVGEGAAATLRVGEERRDPEPWTGTWTEFYRQGEGHDFLFDFHVGFLGAGRAVLDCEPGLKAVSCTNGTDYALDRPLVFFEDGGGEYGTNSVLAGGIRWKSCTPFPVDGTYAVDGKRTGATLYPCDLTVTSTGGEDVADEDEWWRGLRITSDEGVNLSGCVPDDVTGLVGERRFELTKKVEDGDADPFTNFTSRTAIDVWPIEIQNLMATGPGKAEFELKFSCGGKVVSRDRVTVKVLDVKGRLCADFNHDGKIDTTDEDILKKGGVFRHWINDDADSGDVGTSDSDRPGAQTGRFEFDGRDPNYDNDHVDGKCDLIDFVPVKLNVGCLKTMDIADDPGIEFYLKQADGAVNVIWTSLTSENARSFQIVDAACCGESFVQKPETASTVRVTADGIRLPREFARLILENPSAGVVMVEGREETKAPLVFECKLGGKTLFRAELNLSISGVEEMYRLASLRDAAEAPSFSAEVPPLPTNQPDATKDLDVFFLHGFNVNAEAARAWGSEVFKRLYQSGSNARFHMLPWRGDYRWVEGVGLTTTLSALHYPHNAWFAQRTGGALKRYVEAAQPDSAKRILMTQSLGNMVGCEALREGLFVSKYFMFDAAVPSEAIDGALRAEDSGDATFQKYVRPDWRDYTNACWASNWHRLFERNVNDARAQMGWSNRFAEAVANATEVFNYYSSGDAVFTEVDDVPSLLDDVVHWDGGFNWLLHVIPYPDLSAAFENHSWQKQEVLKGMSSLAGTASGGWGFMMFASNRFYVYEPGDGALHVHWTSHRPWAEEQFFVRNVSDGSLTPITESELKSRYGVTDDQILIARTTRVPALVPYSPYDAVSMVVDESIKDNPIFDVNGAQEMLNANATDDDVFLALAKHVPALSSPVGGTNVVLGTRIENQDLNEPNNYRNGWGRNHPTFKKSWLHSDMKDMAHFYVYKLYEQLVRKGNLK